MATDREPDHRLRFVESLDEDAFRKIVLVPLLSRLGYREIVEYHGGSAEKGKDIVCWYDDPMERRRYVALVVKKGDIHGAVGKGGNASEVLYQVQQTLNEPYRDIYGLAELRIDECIVATTGRIKNTAIESISGTLAAANLDRIMRLVDQQRVVDLVTKPLLSKTAWTPIGGARGMGLEGPDLARIGAEVSMVLNGSCPRRSRSAAATGLDEEPPVAFRRACPATP